MKESTDQIDEKLGKTIFRFPVLHLGWEADGWGYVIEKDGKRDVILSNHGKFYTASIKELEQKIAEYTKVKFDTKKAIALVTNNGKLD
jgi:3-dehydroquinate dehydratase